MKIKKIGFWKENILNFKISPYKNMIYAELYGNI